MCMLEESNLVAVYGSLRGGLSNHCVLNDSTLKGEERVTGWDMFSLGGFPAIIKGDGDITIEVYEVHDKYTADGLDMLEGYPSFYDRKLIDTTLGKAWIYFQNSPPSHSKVDSGDWKEYLQSKNGEWY